jgi:hypothetical protein
MRSNLMAAMGLGKMNPQGSQSAKRRSTRNSNVNNNNSEFFDETDSSVPFIDFLGAAKVQAQAAAAATQQDASQNPQAPSPKRARSRKSMAPPTVPRASGGRATRSSTQGFGAGGRGSAVKRQPLRAVDGNVSPSKSGTAAAAAGSQKGGVSFKGFGGESFDESEVHGGGEGFEDTTTFDGSEIFTSTPGITLGGHGGGEGLPDDDTEMV